MRAGRRVARAGGAQGRSPERRRRARRPRPLRLAPLAAAPGPRSASRFEPARAEALSAPVAPLPAARGAPLRAGLPAGCAGSCHLHGDRARRASGRSRIAAAVSRLALAAARAAGGRGAEHAAAPDVADGAPARARPRARLAGWPRAAPAAAPAASRHPPREAAAATARRSSTRRQWSCASAAVAPRWLSASSPPSWTRSRPIASRAARRHSHSARERRRPRAAPRQAACRHALLPGDQRAGGAGVV